MHALSSKELQSTTITYLKGTQGNSAKNSKKLNHLNQFFWYKSLENCLLSKNLTDRSTTLKEHIQPMKLSGSIHIKINIFSISSGIVIIFKFLSLLLCTFNQVHGEKGI